jgi:hypothetical protein
LSGKRYRGKHKRNSQSQGPSTTQTSPTVKPHQEVHSGITKEENEDQAGISNKALVDRINRSDRWMIGLTGAIAGGGIISAIIFGWQLTVMRGQLNESRFENRPWVGLENIQSDAIIENGKPFKITVFIKNFGKSPSPKVKGCIGSDTPNIHQRDRVEITKMMDQLSKCPDPIAAVLMPSGNVSFDVTRKAELMTTSVAADINREFATFAAFGRLDYEDADGIKYWTTFCALYLKDGSKYNACAYGTKLIKAAQAARAHMARSISA